MAMRTIGQIYEAYNIMPNLREHQLRVAGVAKVICEAMETPLDTRSAVEACLLHDMGNILKFDLTRFPEFAQEKGLAYWEGIKSDFQKRYGHEEHVATYAIANEIGVCDKTMACLKAVGFSQAVKQAANPTWEHKICCYADQRVGPYGIFSLEERIQEGLARKPQKSAIFDASVEALRELERQIFAKARVKPEEVGPRVTPQLIEELRGWTLTAPERV